MMAVKTTRYDISEHLTTAGLRAAYLAEALETGDDALIRKALANVARAQRMAADADRSRQSADNALSDQEGAKAGQ